MTAAEGPGSRSDNCVIERLRSHSDNCVIERLRLHIADVLTRSRARTRLLTEAVNDADLVRQHSPIMSPLVWDLAHVGNQEEMWLVRDVGGRDPVRADIDDLYDAFKHARADRPALPLLTPDESRSYVGQVRDKVWDVLAGTRFSGSPLAENGFAFGLIAQHEQQHSETMLATHQLRVGDPVLTAPAAPTATAEIAMARIPAGAFVMGTSADPWALDNERPAHRVFVPEFEIDRFPITNAQFLEFIGDGGYSREELWSPAGWRHRHEAGLVSPQFWAQGERGEWGRFQFGEWIPLRPNQPVVHVCYYEAEAYAAWVGKRLPTEAEWEKAARHDPHTEESRRYPWGATEPNASLANLGQRHLSPADIGAYPGGGSAFGVEQMVGDVWEWTSTVFDGYPGFRAFPYREYSEVFFDDGYRVLRGGSFGTDPVACRGTFRNWDFPIRRQIFAGFRCAQDAVS